MSNRPRASLFPSPGLILRGLAFHPHACLHVRQNSCHNSRHPFPPNNCFQGRKWKAENMFSPHTSATFSRKKTLLRNPSAACPLGHMRQAELQWRLSKVTFHLSVSIPLLRNRQGKGKRVKMITGLANQQHLP